MVVPRILEELAIDEPSLSEHQFIRFLEYIDAEDPSSTMAFKNAQSYEAMAKREFGNMLPKSGVYFLPDFRVIEYLR